MTRAERLLQEMGKYTPAETGLQWDKETEYVWRNMGSADDITIKMWIEINRDNIQKYWKQQINTFDLENLLIKI
jgi:hypothetical protein